MADLSSKKRREKRATDEDGYMYHHYFDVNNFVVHKAPRAGVGQVGPPHATGASPLQGSATPQSGGVDVRPNLARSPRPPFTPSPRRGATPSGRSQQHQQKGVSPLASSPQRAVLSPSDTHALHDVNNSVLERELARQEHTLEALRRSLSEIKEVCRGYGSIDAAVRATEQQALSVGEEVARLEEKLAYQLKRESDLRATCGRLAGEAKAVREYVPLLKAEVDELKRAADREGIAVDLTPLTIERALRRFRSQVEKDSAMLKELRAEAAAIDAAIAAADGSHRVNSDGRGPDELREELRQLEAQEARLVKDVSGLEEEVAVNEEVLSELKRQISLAFQQLEDLSRE